MEPAKTTWVRPSKTDKNDNVIDAILKKRGITRKELSTPYSGDPSLIHDMDKAVKIILDAVKNEDKTAIYGDYDVDGITSTAIMMKTLRATEPKRTPPSESKFIPYIPMRDDGYGIKEKGVKELADAGVKLIITVDNGTHADEAIKMAQSMGIKVIVTDQHQVREEAHVGEPEALVNPTHPDSKGEYSNLSGAGVAYMLSGELFEKGLPVGLKRRTELKIELAAIAALGTVADMMPLLGVNRDIANLGLPHFQDVLGLNKLVEVTRSGGFDDGAQDRQVDTEEIYFQLGPRINAAGRKGDPGFALLLLMTEDETKAKETARFLTNQNIWRKDATKQCVYLLEREVYSMADDKKAIVLWDEDIPKGIAGLVASRFAEKYGVTTWIGCQDKKTGEITGSARAAASGVSCLELLNTADNYLVSGGGHEAAAGFSVKKDDAEVFRELIEKTAEELMHGKPVVKPLEIDLMIDRLLTDEEMQEIRELGPWGKGLESPIIASCGLTILNWATKPKSGFTTMELTDGKRVIQAHAFEPPHPAPKVGQKIDLAYKIGTRDSLQAASLEISLEKELVSADLELG